MNAPQLTCPTALALPDHNASLLDFIKTIFGPVTESPVWIQSLGNADTDESSRDIATRNPADVAAFISKWDRTDRGMYFCVSTIDGANRTKENVAEIIGLWVDIDFKDTDDKPDEVTRKLLAARCLPSIINNSGNGRHAYWLFKEAVIGNTGNQRRIETALKLLCDMFGGDMTVTHAAALMRLPGTHNTKFGKWIEVTTIAHSDVRYELDNLEDWLSEASPAILRKNRPAEVTDNNHFLDTAKAQGFKPSIDVEKRLAAMSYMAGGDAAIHSTQLSVSASLLNTGSTIDEVVEVVLAATRSAATGYGERWNWAKEEKAIAKMCSDWLKKHPVTTDPDQIVVDEDNAAADDIHLDDFVAFLPTSQYFHRPTGAMWTPNSIKAKIARVSVGSKKVAPTDWLNAFRCAVQMTWAPGEPPEIRDKIITDGGWIGHPGAMCLNVFRPATVVLGKAAGAGRWLDLVRKVYPEGAEHIIRWLACRVQRPEIKINHCLFLGGSPGIGKDTMLAPVINAVGPWNCQEIAPKALLGSFNGYIKGVIVRISEARDLGDTNRYEFYEASKTLCAAPPDVLRCNEKHTKEFYVLNICGLILTSNYRTDGIFLPADDRRHYVCWSDVVSSDFDSGYWKNLWTYYRSGGFEDVAAYLMTLDLADFDPTAPPLKTDAFWAVVDAGAAPEDSEFADVLDMIDRPDAVTLSRMKLSAPTDLSEWLEDRRNRRTIPHRFEKCGFLPERNTSASDGYFVVDGRRQAIYVKSELTKQARWEAAVKLSNGGTAPTKPLFPHVSAAATDHSGAG
jgi:Family of unknown function (DUF5906)/RepB DNA-primase from phage plasmid